MPDSGRRNCERCGQLTNCEEVPQHGYTSSPSVFARLGYLEELEGVLNAPDRAWTAAGYLDEYAWSPRDRGNWV